MANILDDVNRRTQLVGANRLELLLFRLGGRQLYGINVFKVQEVIRCPDLTRVPNSSPKVRGIAKLRGKTIPVVDLSMCLAGPPLQDIKQAFVIIADYNRSVQGFLVDSVDRIVNMNWEDIMAPPKGTGRNNYMTAVTQVDDKLVEIIDVEKVLADLVPATKQVSESVVAVGHEQQIETLHILVADDSSVARNQIKRTLDQLGVESILVKDGKEALVMLKGWVDGGDPVNKHINMVISDVEMPNMDGYTLTTEIRKDPRLQHLYVMLHTSLSGVFNQAMVQKVGADCFVAKFDADEFATAVMKAVSDIGARRSAA